MFLTNARTQTKHWYKELVTRYASFKGWDKTGIMINSNDFTKYSRGTAFLAYASSLCNKILYPSKN